MATVGALARDARRHQNIVLWPSSQCLERGAVKWFMDFSEILSELRKQGRKIGHKTFNQRGILVEVDDYLLPEGDLKMLAGNASMPTWEWVQKRDEHKAEIKKLTTPNIR